MNYLQIANNIIAIRYYKSLCFYLPNDIEILKAYEDLCIYVFSNFELPESHTVYILNAFGIKNRTNKHATIAKIKQNHEKIESNFSIEIPLRAIECFFSWGTSSEVDYNKIIKLNFLIAKLHCLVGEKN